MDASEVKLSRRRFAAATLAFSGAMKLDREAQNVGLLLPASNAASIANMAVMLKGRAAVNLNFSAAPALTSQPIALNRRVGKGLVGQAALLDQAL